MPAVFTSDGRSDYIKKFITVNENSTYYFFESNEVKNDYQRNRNEDICDSCCVISESIHYKEDTRLDLKFAIRMKLIDANHVPGSCMFVFWIYRINNHSILGAPKLFIYTGDYRLNDTIENKLMEYRHKERCYDTTIVNDNNREDDIDNALPTPAKAIERMKEFIDSHKEQHHGSIAVTIGADWGMEDIWAQLAKEYNTRICVDTTMYREIMSCWGKDIGKYFMSVKHRSGNHRFSYGNRIRYFF